MAKPASNRVLKNPLVFFSLEHVLGGFASFSLALFFSACTTTTETTTMPRQQSDQPRGFFQKFIDEVTERECNVGKFTCPYGLGPAGEPCDCTDPSGIVLKGQTVK
jgi:hypothetical protein